LIRVRHTLRFAIALYLLYGWIYYLSVHAHVSLYMYYFTLFFFPLWILYEDVIDYLEFHDTLTNIVINLFSLPVPYFFYYTLSHYTYYYLTFVYVFLYVLFGVIINIYSVRVLR